MPSSSDPLKRSFGDGDLPDPRESLSLLAEAQAGDTTALEELVSRYYARLRRIVRIQLHGSTVGRHLESVDIVQETFRAALPALGDLRPASAASLLQWLAMIATNRIRDAHDGLHTQKRDIGREEGVRGSGDVAEVEHQAAADLIGPDDEAALIELRELLDEHVAALPPDQRRVVLMRDYCGEEWGRIAAELNRDKGAARQLHQRAWIRLRTALRPRLGSAW